MIANLLQLGTQPSEIESMTYSRMAYYNEFAEILLKVPEENNG